jgi:Mor family transcriptional regulator
VYYFDKSVRIALAEEWFYEEWFYRMSHYIFDSAGDRVRAVILERYNAGESIASLAYDYQLTKEAILEIIKKQVNGKI